MEAKEILSRVKQLFNELVTPAPVAAADPAAAPAATEYEIKGGGKVTIDKLEVGGIVMIDGAPALPGDIELADGTKLTIGDNGVISALIPAAAAPVDPSAPTAAPEDMGAKFSAFETATNEKFASYESKFANYEAKFQAYEAKLSKQHEMIEQLLQFGKLMVEAPAAPADPAVKTQNNFKHIEGVKPSSILFGNK